MDFNDCREKVLKLLPELDLSSMVAGRDEEEGGDEQIVEELEIAIPTEATRQIEEI